MTLLMARSHFATSKLPRAFSAIALAAACLAPATPALSCDEHSVKVTESVTMTAPLRGNTLRIENPIGELTIVVDDNATELKAEIVKTGRGEDEAIAKEVLEAIEVTFAPGDDQNTTLASVHVPKSATKGKNRGFSVDWRITAPSNFKIRAKNDIGDVNIAGFRSGISLNAAVGDVNLADIQGGVEAKLSVGDFTATNIKGGIDVRGETGSFDIESDGKITCTSNVGDVKVKILDGDTGDVVAKSDIGTVSIHVPENRSGTLSARTDMGGVTVKMDQTGMTAVKKSSSRFSAQLAGASSNSIEAESDIGSIVIHGYNPG